MSKTKSQEINMEMGDVNASFSVITLNVNALSCLIKKLRWQNGYIKVTQKYAIKKSLHFQRHKWTLR